MRFALRHPRGLAVCMLLLAAACTDRDNPMGPEPTPEPGTTLAVIECKATVQSRTLSCAPVSAPTGGARFENRTIGGNGQYVKILGSNVSYDSGTEIWQATVAVQSLVGQVLGTDGVSTTGLNVFFHSGPSVSGGSGNVEVANEDGTGTFTAAGQPYYLYNQTLAPYQISSSKNWQISVDNTVTSFTFMLYISTQTAAGGDIMDLVWDGSTLDSLWTTAANWTDNAVPGSTSVVSIPAASLLAAGANYAKLNGNATVAALGVGTGSTLDLTANTLEVSGNVDAVGTVSNGTLTMSGASALLQGNVNALQITGATSLQGSTRATGAVSVTGSLTVANQALNISIP